MHTKLYEMDRTLVLVSFAILSFCGIRQSAQTLALPDNQTSPIDNKSIDFRFPSGLLIGAGISSFQHEGASNISDKSISYLDRSYRRTPPVTNFYYKYQEDIDLLKNIGFDSFRFSISWTRLLPNGTADYISKEGLDFYNRVLDELENRGIKPFVIIYHWDHPHKFEIEGGWLNSRMIDLFANYSRVVFEEFGNRVKLFGTINEPEIYCKYFSVLGDIPEENERYKCHINMMKAHALAYHIYDKEFRHLQNGQVGIVTLCNSFYAYSDSQEDLEARENAHAFDCGWTVHPIFSKGGDYPDLMKTNIAARSAAQGHDASRLPELSKEWIDKLKNSSDFFGLNHYSSWLVKRSDGNLSTWPNDGGFQYLIDPKWPRTQHENLLVVPQGLGDILREIKNKYNNVPVYILENGVSSEDDTNDYSRIQFFYAYMKEMLIAIKRDKCDVRMYSLWSFLDGFEWEETKKRKFKFGIIHVDFNDTNYKRTPKNSALWFKKILKFRKLYF